MAPQTAGHWGPWGIYEPPEGRPTLAIWEQYLKELRGLEFAEGAVPVILWGAQVTQGRDYPSILDGLGVQEARWTNNMFKNIV